MKVDQIAFYCQDEADAAALKRSLGLSNDEWISDTVTAESFIFGHNQKQTNVAMLQFNYQLGIELEIIRYVSGPHWHAARNPLAANRRFYSHTGIHLDDGEDFPAPGLLVQETWTQSHTAEYLTTGAAAGRRYHYRIFELAPAVYIKYIRRIHGSGLARGSSQDLP
jgi:hypothetical protein